MIRTVLFIFLINCLFTAKAQEANFMVGTDFPYQYYAGVSIESNRLGIAYRTGILAPPYSNAVLFSIGALGVDEIYIDILEPAFQFGWMNGINPYIKLGENQLWYAGPEVRFDYLTSSSTSGDLIESVVGTDIFFWDIYDLTQKDVELSLSMIAAGVRAGRKFLLGEKKRHVLKIELSAFKHIYTHSGLTIDEDEAPELNEKLNTLLWEDVFSKYGYLGGLGISYSFSF